MGSVALLEFPEANIESSHESIDLRWLGYVGSSALAALFV